jgi:diguanylate cyclase (GGDEF)-like protein
MGIEENAIRVLVTIADYGQQPNDTSRGRYELGGKELTDLTDLQANDLSDAVDLLDSRGLVKLRRFLGTHPYTFGTVGLKPEGRQVAEKHSGKPQLHEIDPLLQIRNRGAFDADLRLILKKCEPGKVPVALLMIDIDHFKPFNDDHGHQAGDRVLKETAITISKVVGTKGNCYRYGGEEMVVLLPNYTHEEALPLAERIRTSIASIQLAGLPQVTVTMGLSLTEPAGYDPDGLLKAADDALYAGKNAGRNVVKFS